MIRINLTTYLLLNLTAAKEVCSCLISQPAEVSTSISVCEVNCEKAVCVVTADIRPEC